MNAESNVKGIKTCVVASSVMIKGGKTLLLKHKKLGVWIWPGGHVEEGETPMETVLREIREETGYNAKLIHPKRTAVRIRDKVTQEIPRPFVMLREKVSYKEGMHVHYDSVFLAMPVGRQHDIADGESAEMDWFTLEEARKLHTFPNVKQILEIVFKLEGK